jgi:hypothetical protein
MSLDTQVADECDNPAEHIKESFVEEDVNLKAVLVDRNASMDGFCTKILLLAIKDIKAGDELFYEKGKNYYANLGTFQDLSEKEQSDCKAYYDIKLSDMVPKLKSWKNVLHKGSGTFQGEEKANKGTAAGKKK